MLRENCSYWVKQPSTRLDLADLSIAFLWPFNFGWWIDLSHSYMMIKQIKRNAKVNAINPTREAPQNSSSCHLQRHSSDDVNKEGHSAAAHVATKIKSAGYITSHPSQWSGTMCSKNWWSQPTQKKKLNWESLDLLGILILCAMNATKNRSQAKSYPQKYLVISCNICFFKYPPWFVGKTLTQCPNKQVW